MAGLKQKESLAPGKHARLKVVRFVSIGWSTHKFLSQHGTVVREFYGWRDKFGENSGLFSLFLLQYPEIVIRPWVLSSVSFGISAHKQQGDLEFQRNIDSCERIWNQLIPEKASRGLLHNICCLKISVGEVWEITIRLFYHQFFYEENFWSGCYSSFMTTRYVTMATRIFRNRNPRFLSVIELCSDWSV